jgi:hypothetical protein
MPTVHNKQATEVLELLDRIEDGATGQKMSVPELLRLCMRLGASLQTDELVKWAKYELNGYSSRDELPDYRQSESQVLGHFSGPFGRELRNAPIPRMNVNKDHHWLFTNYMTEPVAELELLAGGDPSSALQAQWPADAIALYQEKFYEHMVLTSAWRVMSKAAIAGILDTIRTRVLEFVLQTRNELGIEKISSKGEPPRINKPKLEKVPQIVNNTIYGGNQAFGNVGDTTQNSTQIQPGDLASLKEYLRQLGLTDEIIDDLDDALSADADSKNQPGPATRSWLSRVMIKIGSGTLSVASNAAGSLIATALMQYLQQHH